MVSNELERIGPIVASELEDLKLDVKAEQDEIGPRAAAASKRSVLISEILAGAAIIIGVIFAWLIGRGISQPIVQITEVMKKLAAGTKKQMFQVSIVEMKLEKCLKQYWCSKKT